MVSHTCHYGPRPPIFAARRPGIEARRGVTALCAIVIDYITSLQCGCQCSDPWVWVRDIQYSQPAVPLHSRVNSLTTVNRATAFGICMICEPDPRRNFTPVICYGPKSPGADHKFWSGRSKIPAEILVPWTEFTQTKIT